MILPAHLPDETLCSVLSRMCRLNGISDFRDIAATYFGKPVYASFIDAKICVPEFCLRTNNAFGDPTKLLDRMTWLGAQTRSGEIDTSHLRRIEQGGRLPSLGELTFPDSTAVAYCPECLKSDISQFGMTYWHRTHQLTVVRYCPWHGCLIVRVRLERKNLHNRFPLPGDLLSHSDGGDADGIRVADFWRGVAVMTCEVMQMPPDPFGSEIINQTLWDELRIRGLVTASGGLRKTEIAGCLSNLFGIEPTEGYAEVPLMKQIIHSLVQQKKGVTLGRMALVHWLFGNWQSFEERCRWTAMLGAVPGLPSANTESIALVYKMRERHRQNCMTFMLANPGCSRLEFTKAEYRSFRWLLHNDRVWLDRQLPNPSRASIQLCLL